MVKFDVDLFAKNERAIVLVYDPKHVLTGCVFESETVAGFAVQNLLSVKVVQLYGRAPRCSMPSTTGVVDTVKAIHRYWFMKDAMDSNEWKKKGEDLLMKWGVLKAEGVEDEQDEEEIPAYFCIPEGPLFRDVRSRRRVVRMVAGEYSQEADKLGIPVSKVPETMGAHNEEVISRLRRTPTKRTRHGGAGGGPPSGMADGVEGSVVCNEGMPGINGDSGSALGGEQ
ncbi:unnamed protein product [Closterium sp. Naga37s-1]|nr:unnamed protein product [Closterium sp. Naga37s-1]